MQTDVKVNDVHRDVASGVHGARPPFFEFTWRDDGRLGVQYHSHRGLIPVLAGLVRGLGHHYGEEVRVELEPDDFLTVEFRAVRSSAA